eukprot:scaffold62435_cov62-Phaeocystis_antarctica.AAC.1
MHWGKLHLWQLKLFEKGRQLQLEASHRLTKRRSFGRCHCDFGSPKVEAISESRLGACRSMALPASLAEKSSNQPPVTALRGIGRNGRGVEGRHEVKSGGDP